MVERAGDAVRRREWRPGALGLLLPLFLVVIGAAFLLAREARRSPASPPDVSSPDEAVAAFSGELAGAAGWLSATLCALHAEPERQAFEAAALARSLGLEPGEPWRLSVRWQSKGAVTAVAPPGDRPARSAPAGIALGPVEVFDAAGRTLRSFEPPPPPGPLARPAQPLAILLGPPPGALHPGESADWILWGWPPEGELRLTGLVPEDDEQFRAVTGFGGAFALRATRLRRGDLLGPLARLDRGAAGKNADLGPSEGQDGGSRREDP